MTKTQDRGTIPFWFLTAVIAYAILFMLVMTVVCHAEESTPEAICQAIWHAEGGFKTNHPYGILAKYKHTSPRQACINTVKHKYRDWNGRGEFLTYLASRYAPLKVANDPLNLNINWLKNVRYWLKHPKEARQDISGQIKPIVVKGGKH